MSGWAFARTRAHLAFLELVLLDEQLLLLHLLRHLLLLLHLLHLLVDCTALDLGNILHFRSRLRGLRRGRVP